MAIRQIRIWPDPALSQAAELVACIDESTQQLVADLFETMYTSNGIGLAANQVGVLLKVLTIDLDPNRSAKQNPELQEELQSWGYQGPQAFINPVIVESSGSIVWEEGCLSVPGYVDQVTRKEHVRVTAQNEQGETFTHEASGLYAVAIQHEMDHLEGKVFVEYLSRLKQNVVKRKMNRLKSEGTTDGVTAAALL